MDLKEQIMKEITSIDKDIFGCEKEKASYQKWVNHYQSKIEQKKAIRTILREKLKLIDG